MPNADKVALLSTPPTRVLAVAALKTLSVVMRVLGLRDPYAMKRIPLLPLTEYRTIKSGWVTLSLSTTSTTFLLRDRSRGLPIPAQQEQQFRELRIRTRQIAAFGITAPQVWRPYHDWMVRCIDCAQHRLHQLGLLVIRHASCGTSIMVNDICAEA